MPLKNVSSHKDEVNAIKVRVRKHACAKLWSAWFLKDSTFSKSMASTNKHNANGAM
jgi:hypothetical protein